MKYDIVIRVLPEEKGGGFLGLVPDLQGCMSDGDTYEEALANTVDAMAEWLETNAELGREAPVAGWRAQLLREEKEALTRAIHVLSSDLSNRLNDVEAKVVELQKVLRDLEAISEPHKLYSVGTTAPYKTGSFELCH